MEEEKEEDRKCQNLLLFPASMWFNKSHPTPPFFFLENLLALQVIVSYHLGNMRENSDSSPGILAPAKSPWLQEG